MAKAMILSQRLRMNKNGGEVTMEQDNYKKQIIKYISSDEKFITVKGQPGSGKTLLIYDIAKYFSDSKYSENNTNK